MNNHVIQAGKAASRPLVLYNFFLYSHSFIQNFVPIWSFIREPLVVVGRKINYSFSFVSFIYYFHSTIKLTNNYITKVSEHFKYFTFIYICRETEVDKSFIRIRSKTTKKKSFVCNYIHSTNIAWRL